MQEQHKDTKANRAKDDVKKNPPGLLARFSAMDTKKKIQVVAAILVIVVMLAIYFSSSQGGEATQNGQSSDTLSATPEQDSVEEKLKATLERISGAGQVEVMITYASSAEIVPAISVDTQLSTTTDMDEDGSSTTNNENTQREVVTIDGGSQALVLREESAVIKGIIVIAEGADDIGVRLDLLSAVQTVLNVDPDQVDVFKMNNE